MKFTLKKKIVAGAVAVTTVVGMGGAAFAYWTTSGTGSATASTGTSSAVSVSQVGTVSGLVPGGSAGAINFKINNPATFNQYISTVTVAITNVTSSGTVDAGHPACSASDFTLVQPTAINSDLTPGDHTYSPSGASLALNDTGANQDNCKNSTISLSFTAA